jgi:putative IMPACT (imprinted ancient) family translation regulator
MKRLFIIAFILGIYQVNAQQRTCGTTQKLEQKLASDPIFRAHHQQVSQLLNNAQLNPNSNKSTNVVVTIPVVVHVLYKDATQNISDAQINSQITILNNDYRKTNADFTTAVPAVFQPFGADLEINFVLAKRTIDNLPTTGIERKSVDAAFIFEDQYFTSTGLTAWDTTKYLNIWVGRFTDTSLLGFAYPPSNQGSPDDGLCIGDEYFGNTGTATAPFNLGRTGTHEIGHYFNLDHPWGGGNGATGATCGVGANSDNVADTPSKSGPTYGCPSFPNNAQACTASPNGSMFMNYMDYVNDACMAFFTAGQKIRTTNAINGPRASLLTSLGGVSLANENFIYANSIKTYPNPNSGILNIESSVAIDKLEIYNNIGQSIKSISIIENQTLLNINELSSGVYFLKIYNDNTLMKIEKIIKI